MPPVHPGPERRLRRVAWSRATRIIASRYPPIDLFERVSADPAVWEALVAAEQLVNPRVRDAVGEIRLVPLEDRVSGPGASYVMASFTHPNPKGSRFSDGSYGVYYAAREFVTALRETAYHFARFATDSADAPRYEDMRVLVGRIDNRFDDVAALPAAARAQILDPGSYAVSQPFGAALREAGSSGLVYPSVRNPGGRCVGAFRPKAVGIPVQSKHVKYHWDGSRVTRYFDYETDAWRAVWPQS
ncbi:MAG: RES family NAD+ phosphorylase [Gammaproteobacteria bacterium]|nr:RES family NAD+ phosphorylase [Gammaproteobacteria bacterium]NIR85445.1 RES family NAD+ phosphorylase [Gammaproteobacteria bacterium]NIR89496.1 RES family NAD+ phosphorylase [Gammaproteobacteria bacterium]NIU06581.1 RES family NAD+ phosphorylase [Gammaproteobacteria bacterium]NIV53464.1 RES domain-containing protein [Gammaproteobacteria bacterium]